MTSQEVLNEAANLIEKYGWQRGWYGGEDYGFCVRGAINAAFDWCEDGDVAIFSVILNAVAEVTGTPALAAWNDAPGRTKEEVINALRSAANL